MSDAANTLAHCLMTSLTTSRSSTCMQAASVTTSLTATPSSESVSICDDRDLICAFCEGVLVDPVTAHCGHSCCKRCSAKGDFEAIPYNIACPRCSASDKTVGRGLYDHTSVPGYDSSVAPEPDILVRNLVERWWAPEVRAARVLGEVERLVATGNKQRALRVCDEGLQHAPTYSPLLAQRSLVFNKLGDFHRALQDADSVIRLRPTWPMGYYHRGCALSGLGLAEEALVAHCIGASLDRDNNAATTEVSQLLHRILSPVSSVCSPKAGFRLLTPPRRCSIRTSVPANAFHSARRKSGRFGTYAGNSQIFGPIRGLLRRLKQELERSRRLQPRSLLQSIETQFIETSDFDCILCCRTLLKPAVTPCGHTYCRTCLERCLDYSPACPLCMRPLSDCQILSRKPSTKFLESAMKLLIPSAYNTRKREDESQKEARLPVFVCTTAYPSVPCPLFVSEPRYRLMIRRCIESGSRCFGIASCLDNRGIGSRQKLADYGTLLEVRDHVLLHNGSSILTAVGSKRFRIVERDEKDGYDLARVEFIMDQQCNKVHELMDLHDRVREEATNWFGHMAQELKAEIHRSFGKIPDVEENWLTLPDGPAWAWWILAILPLGPKLQVGVLSSINLEKRLRAIDKTLEYIRFHRNMMETQRDGASQELEDVVTAADETAIWRARSAASCQTIRESNLTTSMDL